MCLLQELTEQTNGKHWLKVHHVSRVVLSYSNLMFSDGAILPLLLLLCYSSQSTRLTQWRYLKAQEHHLHHDSFLAWVEVLNVNAAVEPIDMGRHH